MRERGISTESCELIIVPHGKRRGDDRAATREFYLFIFTLKDIFKAIEGYAEQTLTPSELARRQARSLVPNILGR